MKTTCACMTAAAQLLSRSPFSGFGVSGSVIVAGVDIKAREDQISGPVISIYRGRTPAPTEYLPGSTDAPLCIRALMAFALSSRASY